MTGLTSWWYGRLLAAAVALLAVPTVASAGMIYNSFGPGFSVAFGEGGPAIENDPEAGFYQSYAQAFHTPGGSALMLDQIYLPFGVFGDDPTVSPVIVSLYTSAPGSLGGPDSLVAVLTNSTYLADPDDPFATPLFGYTPAGTVLLSPDTEYWVVAEVPPVPGSFSTGTAFWLYSSVFTPNRGAVRTSTDGDWTVFDDQEDLGFLPAAMRVDVTAVPAPPGVVLFGLGLACLGLTRRFHRPAGTRGL